MVKMKKGILKKTGCILISASIILTGVTFFGSSVSEADVDEPEIVNEADTPEDDTTVLDDVTLDKGDTEDIGGEDIDNTGDDPMSGDDIVNPDDSAKGDEPTADTPASAAGDDTAVTGDKTEVVADKDATENKAEEEKLDKAKMLEQSLVATPRMLNATSLLGASNSSNYTDPSTGAEYSDSSMTTLVTVPSEASGYGNTFTIPSSVTTIEAGAFSSSDILYLTITDASKITSFSTSQGDWPKTKVVIYCPNDEFDASYALVDFQNMLGDKVQIEWGSSGGGEDPSEIYTITYAFKLTDSTGAEVTTIPDAVTESVEEGELPSGVSDTSYVYQGTTYNRVTSEDPTLDIASGPATYTYTFKSSAVIKKWNITIVYQLKDAAGKEVTSFEVTTLEVVEGTTPTYDAQSTYTYGDASYALTSSPTLVPATKNDTYTYEYTLNANAYVIKYQLVNASGEQVAIQTIASTTDPTTFTPDQTYTYNNVDYSLTSTTPSVEANVYTYVFKSSSSSGGGSGGGSSSGGGSGSSGGSGGGPSVVTPSGANVSEAAKTTVKYVITEGAGQVVGQKDGAVRIVCNGPVEKLSYILMDGNIIPTSNYTIVSGSTILTLNADYIANLAVGDHAVQFQYTDGYAITGLRINAGATKTTTTVTYKVASDGTISAGHIKDTTPKTADGFDTRYLLCLAIFLLGAGAIQLSKQKNLEAILAGEKDDYC